MQDSFACVLLVRVLSLSSFCMGGRDGRRVEMVVAGLTAQAGRPEVS